MKKGQTQKILADLPVSLLIIAICLIAISIVSAESKDDFRLIIESFKEDTFVHNDFSLLLQSETEGITFREAIILLPGAEDKDEFKQKYINNPATEFYEKLKLEPGFVGETYELRVTYPDGEVLRMFDPHRASGLFADPLIYPITGEVLDLSELPPWIDEKYSELYNYEKFMIDDIAVEFGFAWKR